ncbi:MAG: hypothetical protein JXR82_04675 [Marinifilaceae bacterium]|nr:hypothetical protein [Marinifilaceae bacterium]
MKKLFALLIFTIGFVGLSKAQQTQTVTFGNSKSYTANPEVGTTADHYVWQLVDASDVSVRDLSAETGATVTILWDLTVGETYRLKSQVVDDNNCSSEFVYVDVTIAGEASVMFADLSTNDNQITCSLVTGDSPANTNFDVVFTGGVAPYELTYEVTDKDGVPTILTKSFAATTGTLSLADFENTTTGTQIVTVTLISALTNDLAVVAVRTIDATNITGKNNVRTLTIYPKPVITNLSLN